MRTRRTITSITTVVLLAFALLSATRIALRHTHPSPVPSVSQESESTGDVGGSELSESPKVDDWILATNGRRFVDGDNHTYMWSVQRQDHDKFVITELDTSSGRSKAILLQVRDNCVFQMNPSMYAGIPLDHDVYWFCAPGSPHNRSYIDSHGVRVEEELSDEWMDDPRGAVVWHTFVVLRIGNDKAYGIESFVDPDKGVQYLQVDVDPAHQRMLVLRKSVASSE